MQRTAPERLALATTLATSGSCANTLVVPGYLCAQRALRLAPRGWVLFAIVLQLGAVAPLAAGAWRATCCGGGGPSSSSAGPWLGPRGGSSGLRDIQKQQTSLRGKAAAHEASGCGEHSTQRRRALPCGYSCNTTLRSTVRGLIIPYGVCRQCV